MNIAFIGVAALFFVGHGLKWVFQKTKFPDVLVLMTVGFLVGPVFNLVTVDDLGKVGPFLTTLALVVILYEGGVRLRASELLSSSLPAAGLALLGFILVGVAGALVTLLFGQPWEIALLVGLGIGSTSSAVVIPMVRMLSIGDRTKTILSLESAFTDVLVIVVFLVIVEAIASGQFSATELMVGIGPDTIQAVLLGIASGLFWAFLKSRFAFITEIPFCGEAWACLSFGIFDLMGFNGAMGVLALGFTLTNLDLLPDWAKSVLSNKPVTEEELKLLGEITFLLKTFFFIYLGMMIQSVGWVILVVATLISILIFVTRYLMVRVVISPKHYSRLDAIIVTSMGPRGLACAVLASIPVTMKIPGGIFVQNVLIAIIPISIIITAVFVMLGEREAVRQRMNRLFGKYQEDAVATKVVPPEELAASAEPAVTSPDTPMAPTRPGDSNT